MKDYDDNGQLRSWDPEDFTVPAPAPTLAQKVGPSVEYRARQYQGEVCRTDAVDVDVKFPTMAHAVNFVYAYDLTEAANVRASDGMFNTPVVITFDLESYARSAGIEV